MRADVHYVEQLDAPRIAPVIQLVSVATIAPRSERKGDPPAALVDSIRRHGVLQPLLVQRANGHVHLIDGHQRLHAAMAAGLREVPCLVHRVDGDPAALAEAANVTRRHHADDRAGATTTSRPLDIRGDLLQSMEAIETCTRLLSNSASSLPHSVAGGLIRAEVWRASCLLQASRIVQEGIPPGQVACSPRRLVTYVAERAEAERRLRGCALHVDNDVPEGTLVAGDLRILATALSGLLLATGAAADGTAGVRMTLAASIDSTRQVEFAVSEVGAGVPAAWESRAFDETWTDRPGGIPAAVCMLAARTIAEAHGGRVNLSTSPRGATAKLIMPIAAA